MGEEPAGWLAGEASRRGYVRIDTVRGASGYGVVEATVEGRPVRMVLDTGASCTILDAASLADLGLTGTPHDAPATGVGGGVQAQEVQVGAFDLGPRPLGARTLGVVDLTAVNDRLVSIGEQPVQGVLGVDVLRAEGALIDVAGEALYLEGAPDR